MKKAIVIGAGVAGLATSIRLARMGWKVDVFEASDGPGGKLTEKRIGGYRFDLGPSLFTLPENVDELFRLCGEEPADHFRYTRLDPVCAYFWNDGFRFVCPAGMEDMIAAIASAFDEPHQRVRRYLDRSAFLYERTTPVFLHQSLHRLKWFSRAVRRGIAAMPRMPLFGTLAGQNSRAFRHPKLVQYFNRYATYNGSDPYQSPAMMMLVPHLEHGRGAYLPEGGMYAIARSLADLAKRQGVSFHFGTRVDAILHDGRQVSGVRTEQAEFHSDVVVSNADMHPTYRHLLKGVPAPEKLLGQEKSSSALIFYWGIRPAIEGLQVHNIFFAEDYPAEFRAIFQDRTFYADPTVYVHLTSPVEKDDAPAGGQNWFVMINAPHQAGQDWADFRSKARSAILFKLSRILGTDVASRIEVEDVLDPVGIESRTSSYLGALYGNASNSPYAAFLRHPNESPVLRNLYFCGGSVHPGGGIPLCLFSARITAGIIEEDHP